MTNKKKMFIGMVVALGLIFIITYYASDRYFEYKKNNPNTNKSIATQNTPSELDDSISVSLYTGDSEDEKLTVKELKSELNLDSDLSQAELSMVLKEKGYALVSAETNNLTFKRESNEKVEPNKYYIGEKDGYLAIYKSDKDGNLLIEDPQDIYSNSKKVEFLGEDDKNKIKNFEFKYDTKEDAEEDLSEFLS